MSDKEKVEEFLNNDPERKVILFDNPSFEGALIGITTDDVAVYSYEKMVESLMKEDNISEEEAVEYIDYNTLGAYVDPKQPIVMYDIN